MSLIENAVTRRTIFKESHPIYRGTGIDLTGSDAPEIFDSLFPGVKPTVIEAFLPEIWIQVGDTDAIVKEFFPIVPPESPISVEPSLYMLLTVYGRTDPSSGIGLALADTSDFVSGSTVPVNSIGVASPYTESGGNGQLSSWVDDRGSSSFYNHGGLFNTTSTTYSQDIEISLRFEESGNSTRVARAGWREGDLGRDYINAFNTSVARYDYTTYNPGILVARHNFSFATRIRIKKLRIG